MADRLPPPPGTMGFREFADHLGKKPSYITQLKREGRLKLTDDGRRVLVAESKRLIADSMDPAKAGVVARHAAARAQAGTTTPPPAQVPASAPHVAPAGEGAATGAEAHAEAQRPAPDADPVAQQRAREQLAQEILKRRALERTEAKELGQLLDRVQVEEALANLVTVLRNRLQAIPSSLAPTLGAADEAGCQTLLGDEIEQALQDLERKFAEIGREE